jgi:hypothetical protein
MFPRGRNARLGKLVKMHAFYLLRLRRPFELPHSGARLNGEAARAILPPWNNSE